MRLFAGTPWDQPPKCDRCGQLTADCACPPLPPPPLERAPPEKQTARLSAQKRAKGKLVTVIAGLREPETDLPELLTQLKNRCGAGGTIRDDAIEIQGQHLDRVRELLSELGYRVRG